MVYSEHYHGRSHYCSTGKSNIILLCTASTGAGRRAARTAWGAFGGRQTLPPPSLAPCAPVLQFARVLPALRRHASLVVIFLIAVTAGLATLQLRGAEAFMAALWHAWDLFLFIVPSLVAGLLLAAALRQLLSPDALARLMGAESGIFGLFIATLVGTLSPGGPMAAFPLVLVLAGAGADRGALVAFILAWSLNGFQKLLVYEAPLLGLDFAMLRTLITFPMPMIAGWIARRVPIAWEPPK